MIVSAPDLIDYMSGINLSAPQETAAAFVLAGIQADLERYLNRPLEPRVVTEKVSVDELTYALATSVSPILSIPSTSPYVLIGDRIYANSLYASGTLWTLSHWDQAQFMTVTYTAGFDARPTSDLNNEFADVRLAIMRVAAREMTNRHDDTVSVKGLETENVGEPTGPQNGVQGWTMDELRMHDRLRKRVIA